MQSFAPTTVNEREAFMDVLRGFAVLGIFIANLAAFSWYPAAVNGPSPLLWPAADDKMSFLHLVFIEGKFYSIFSLLFGWGICLQIDRGKRRGLNALPLVKRRLFFMLCLGAMHLLLWPGDIVFFYALLGFVLLPLRRLSNKAMLITGVLLLLSPIALYAAKMQWPWLNAPAGLLFETGEKLDNKILGTSLTSEKAIASYLAQASWWQVIKANMIGFFHRYGYLFFVSRIPKVLGMFLIGYALGRSGFYHNIQQHIKIVYKVLVIGVLIGLPANFLLAYYMSTYGGEYWGLTAKGLYQTIAYAFGVVPLSLAYVAALLLIFQKKRGKRILQTFAPVGKMAFSNYVFQTIVGSIVFLNAGLGYMGKLGPLAYTVFGVCVYTLQVICSHAWLNRFQYGPLEWLWRSATYRKWQPLKRNRLAAPAQ